MTIFSTPVRDKSLKPLFCVVFILGIGVILSIFKIDNLSSSLPIQSQLLSNNLIQIQYYDELLTMSARMTAATGDLAYKKRYEDNVQSLDLIIQSTYSLLSDPAFQEQLKETDQANATLVAMETEAFKLVDQNKRKEALSLLESIDYHTQKALYWDSLHQASRDMQGQNELRERTLKDYMLLLKFLILLLSLISIGIAYRIYRSQQEMQKTIHQSEALKVILSTISDLVGNNLNHLLLLKMKIDENPDFTEEDRKIFEEAVYGTAAKLKSMREMKEFKVQKTASGEVLDSSRD